MKKREDNTLKLAPELFEILLRELTARFVSHYSIHNIKVFPTFQLYGFDHYNEVKPSLKNYIHLKTDIWVNGKYLYNKVRRFKNGAKEIKLAREYSHVYFQTLGYNDVFEFIRSSIVDPDNRQKQIQIHKTSRDEHLDNEYYVGYYWGENEEVIKTQLTLYDNCTKADWTLVYWDNKEKPSLYSYKGVTEEGETTLSLYFNTGQSSTKRSALISVFIGNKNVLNRAFVLGTYSGFDKQDRPVAGEIIFQRTTSKKEQEKLANSKTLDLTIRSEVTNKRIIANALLPQNKFEFSVDSPYADRIACFSGEYTGYMMNKKRGGMEQFDMIIEEKSNEASLIFNSNRVYKGHVKLINHGTILYGLFSLCPSSSQGKLNLILDSNFYKKNSLVGIYSGIGQKNHPLGGRVFFVRSSYSKNSYSEQENATFSKLGNEVGGNIKKSFLENFFLGREDSFMESYDQLDKLNQFSSSYINDKIESAIYGNYEMFYWDEKRSYIIKDLLIIRKDGYVLLQDASLLYRGYAKVFGDGILSLYFTRCQEKEFYSQFLIFIGKYQSEEVKILSGIRNMLSKDFTPMAQKIVLIKTEKPVKNQVGIKYEVESKLILSLCSVFSVFNNLVKEPYAPSIKAMRFVN